MNYKLLILVLFLVNNINAFTQCKEQLVYSCSCPAEGIYLEDFNAKFSEKNLEKDYWFTLKAGNIYMFDFCYPENYYCKFELYSSDSTLIESDLKSYYYFKTEWGVPPEKYFIKMIADKNTKCAVVVLFFLSKNK